MVIYLESANLKSPSGKSDQYWDNGDVQRVHVELKRTGFLCFQRGVYRSLVFLN